MESNFEKRGYLLEDFRLFHLRSNGMEKVDYHYHDFHKLVLILSGSGAYSVEGRRYLLQPGDMVLVGRGCIHRPEMGSGCAYDRVILYISDEYLASCSVEGWTPAVVFTECGSHVLRLRDAELNQARHELASLEHEIENTEPDAVLLCRCRILSILIHLYRLMRSDNVRLSLPAEPGDEKVLAILHYINDHLTEDIRIDTLSELFYVSKFHMMRRFREETGMPIHAYLNDKRLFLARDLIAKGSSATEACYQCGFRSYSSFSRAYQKRFGVTPTGRVRLFTEDIQE